MKQLRLLEQPTSEEALGNPADLIVVSTGYETRAPQVADRIGQSAAAKICLGFAEHTTAPQRKRNDTLFESLGYRPEIYAGDDFVRVANRVTRELQNHRSVHIALDISSMTRAWYWAIIRRTLEHAIEEVVFTFYYSVARYEPPPEGHFPPRVLGPLAGISTALQMPDKPISLVMGLGYEPDKALGLMEYLEPFETRLFYADPAPDSRFVSAVKKVNREVLRRVEPDNVFNYKYDELLLIFGKLESLLRGLTRVARVIATPLGPKPFGLVLFLAALGHPSVDIWRVSGGAAGAQRRSQPTGEILALRATFSHIDEPT